MWTYWIMAPGLNIAASGSTSITEPSAAMANPVGLFIQAFTETMKNEPAIPAATMG